MIGQLFGAPLSTITLPKKFEPESQVYFPFGGNLDTGRDPQTVGGASGHRPDSTLVRPKGIVPGNGTVLPVVKRRSGSDRSPRREFLA
jgi:hypothetical protein